MFIILKVPLSSMPGDTPTVISISMVATSAPVLAFWTKIRAPFTVSSAVAESVVPAICNAGASCMEMLNSLDPWFNSNVVSKCQHSFGADE